MVFLKKETFIALMTHALKMLLYFDLLEGTLSTWMVFIVIFQKIYYRLIFLFLP